MNLKSVPCNGCTACCHGPVILHPALGDDHRKFDAEWIEGVGYRLKRNPDGSCVYLREGGCSIWPNTPGVCRAFDCRDYVRSGLAAIDPMADDAIVHQGKHLISKANA
jgi:Fe-S-cluster containining protein